MSTSQLLMESYVVNFGFYNTLDEYLFRFRAAVKLSSMGNVIQTYLAIDHIHIHTFLNFHLLIGPSPNEYHFNQARSFLEPC